MSTRTVEQVDDWESVPFDGGYAGLRALSDQEFSGAVVAGPTRLFMLNGTVVGILDGDIDDFESADGTARAAPDEALPLLAVMQERADEVRAQYYTEDTPLSEVDSTLSDGNFTGFIELSENVLSGDYYTVYHQGRSMSVAWVGSAGKLLTGDEAFETADDEVGIYEVKPAAIEPIDIPVPEPDPEPEPGPAHSTTDETGGGAAVDSDATDANEADADATASEPASDRTEATENGGEEPPSRDRGPGPAAGGPPGSKAAGASTGTRSQSAEADDQPTDGGTATGTATRTETDTTGEKAQKQPDQVDSGNSTTTEPPATAADSTQSVSDAATETDVQREAAAETTQSRTDQPPREGQGARRQDDGATAGDTSQAPPGEATQAPRDTQSTPSSSGATGSPETTSADLETRSIPSLDPQKSASSRENGQSSSTPPQQPPNGHTKPAPRRDQPARTDQNTAGTNADPAASKQEPPTRQSGQSRSEANERPSSEPAQQSGPDRSRQDTPTQSPAQSGDHVEDIEAELDERTREIADLEDELTDLRAANEELRSERDRMESELDEARAEIERLEQQLEEQYEGSSPTGTRLTVSEAINGTNLFVRYHSKGKATLQEARDGDATQAEVEENLRLEYHTQFEAADATVDGTPFEQFLQESIQYRFVNWLVRNLLYEIRDTGHAGAMKDLYDGLTAIDRAELNGSVGVTYTEDGQEHRSQERFDVVVRDRMGNPLVVANINDSREPASDDQMTDLIMNAERVGTASQSFAAAFLVTSSFFEPGALETAKEATSTGLFNRDKRKSFVNLSRKDGFHLCLLEARNQEFHLAVPEL